jgi:hypothetical protein
MKRVIFMLILAGALAPLGFAQDLDHGEVGAFADYFHVGQTNTNFVGLGGRLALKPSRYFGFEAEMNYDFDQDFNEGFNNTGTGTVTIVRSDYRILHGLFGPTLSTGHGPVRFFVTAKGGFIDFNFSNAPATFGTFTSTVSGLRSNNWNGAFYPGGGVEAHVGPIGLRLDVGDEMYFNNGTHNNLRVTIGPTFRF